MPIEVSIVTPAYNSLKYLSKTYESIRGQTFKNWEWVVTDDCSEDGTYEWLKEIASTDSRVIVEQNTLNQGAGFSRNQSILKAKGRFIAFLDADDMWHKDKLMLQVAFMKENNLPFTYTCYQKFSDKGARGIVIPPDKIDYDGLLVSNTIGCLTAMYDTNLLGKRYMPLIRKRQDMGLWLNLLKDIPYAYCLNQSLAYYRTDSGMTKNKFSVLKYQWLFYREVEKLSLIKIAYVFPIYMYKGFRKNKI